MRYLLEGNRENEVFFSFPVLLWLVFLPLTLQYIVLIIQCLIAKGQNVRIFSIVVVIVHMKIATTMFWIFAHSHDYTASWLSVRMHIECML